jgi:hypothetical protein
MSYEAPEVKQEPIKVEQPGGYGLIAHFASKEEARKYRADIEAQFGGKGQPGLHMLGAGVILTLCAPGIEPQILICENFRGGTFGPNGARELEDGKSVDPEQTAKEETEEELYNLLKFDPKKMKIHGESTIYEQNKISLHRTIFKYEHEFNTKEELTKFAEELNLHATILYPLFSHFKNKLEQNHKGTPVSEFANLILNITLGKVKLEASLLEQIYDEKACKFILSLAENPFQRIYERDPIFKNSLDQLATMEQSPKQLTSAEVSRILNSTIGRSTQFLKFYLVSEIQMQKTSGLLQQLVTEGPREKQALESITTLSSDDQTVKVQANWKKSYRVEFKKDTPPSQKETDEVADGKLMIIYPKEENFILRFSSKEEACHYKDVVIKDDFIISELNKVRASLESKPLIKVVLDHTFLLSSGNGGRDYQDTAKQFQVDADGIKFPIAWYGIYDTALAFGQQAAPQLSQQEDPHAQAAPRRNSFLQEAARGASAADVEMPDANPASAVGFVGQ